MPVPPAFVAQCRSTARALGYPIPCPRRLPKGFARDNDGAGPGCAKSIVCPGTGPWRGWAVGNSGSATQHLVITATPQRLSNAAHVVNGPGWSRKERVRSLGWIAVAGRRMHAVFVSPDTNDSAFVNHVVLIWSVGDHTYAVGFHDYPGIEKTLALDEQLARNVVLVGP